MFTHCIASLGDPLGSLLLLRRAYKLTAISLRMHQRWRQARSTGIWIYLSAVDDLDAHIFVVLNVPVGELLLTFQHCDQRVLTVQHCLILMDFIIRFSHLLAFLALMSWVFLHSTHTVHVVDTENTQMKHLTVRFLAVCRDNYIFTSCHCYHGKKRKSSTAAISLRCLHISPLPWWPAEWAWLHCASDTPEGPMGCAFLPPLWLSLCCVRVSQLQHRWSTCQD